MLDTSLSDSLDLPGCPDLLILPSDLNSFAKPAVLAFKDAGSTVCINPGRIAKGAKAGSYADIHVMECSGDKANMQQRCKVEIRQV